MAELKLDLPEEVSTEEARLFLAISLHQSGRLSTGKAAELAGCSKRTFLEEMGRRRLPVFNDWNEDLDAEIPS